MLERLIINLKSIYKSVCLFFKDHPPLKHAAVILLALLVLFFAAMFIGQLQSLPQTKTSESEPQPYAISALMADVPDAAVSRGNTITVGFTDPVTIINPLYSTGDGENDAVSLIFESLLQPGGYDQTEGELAKSWTFDPATHQLVFSLQTDHTFEDGRVLSAADVIFTYSCLLSESYDGPLRGRFTAIASVAAGDSADKVVFQLADWVESPDMTLFSIGILKSDYYAVNPDRVFEMGQNNLPPAGSGAYTLVEQQSAQIQLALRTGYAGSIQQISLLQVDSKDKLQMLKDGQLDIVRNVWDTRMQERSENLPGYLLTRFASSIDSTLLINPGIKPGNLIQSADQRLAVLLAAAGRSLSDEQTLTLQSMAASNMTLYYYLGLSDAVKLENEAKAQKIADRLIASGIQVTLAGLDWPELAAKASLGDYDILLLPATANSRLPEQTVILTETNQQFATAWIAEYRQEVFISSNRLAHLSINPAGNPFAALAGTWTDHLENVDVLNRDGSIREGEIS